MTIDAKLKELQSYPNQAPEAFRRQLEAAKSGSMVQLGTQPPSDRGQDRSRELAPVARPTIIKTLVGA